MFYQQTPAGNRVCLTAEMDCQTWLDRFFSPFVLHWYDSGTGALAAAIKTFISSSSKQAPEVILPAYTCPALVSAVIYAGAKPRLVDLQEGSVWMDLGLLESTINEHTLAIIAVDLFGIQERGELIRKVIGSRDILLIEDSAQYFPKSNRDQLWFGDHIILSFGRGKPVSVLNGGLCLSRQGFAGQQEVVEDGGTKLLLSNLKAYLKAKAYNCLVSPHLYWILDSMPMLELGSTKYIALNEVKRVGANQLKYLPATINAYLQSSTELVEQYQRIMSAYDSVQCLDYEGQQAELSRFPVLCASKELRDNLYEVLYQRGVGVSYMYGAAMTDIGNIPSEVKAQGDFPMAKRLAECLLTLPLHSRVSEKDLMTIETNLKAASQ